LFYVLHVLFKIRAFQHILKPEATSILRILVASGFKMCGNARISLSFYDDRYID